MVYLLVTLYMCFLQGESRDYAWVLAVSHNGETIKGVRFIGASDQTGDDGLARVNLFRKKMPGELFFIHIEPNSQYDLVIPNQAIRIPYDREAFSVIYFKKKGSKYTESELLSQLNIVRNYVQILHEEQAKQSKILEDSRDLMTKSTALQTLRDAVSLHDGSNQGQVEAIQYLLAEGHSYVGSDFSGVSLLNAKLAGGDFSKGVFAAANLQGVLANESKFSDADLRFANATSANFQNAILDGMHAPFILGIDLDFEDADLSKSNFFCANLRGANFKNANLKGAAFPFADLRGASFDNADLTEAFFTGAMLKGASFNGSLLDSTNLHGASIDPSTLSDAQKDAVCRHPYGAGHSGHVGLEVKVIEMWPSNKYSSGYQFDVILNEYNGYHNFTEKSLPACTTNPEGPHGYDSRWPGQKRIHLERKILEKAGRYDSFKKRAKDHFAKLSSELSIDNNLRLKHLQKEEWDMAIEKSIQEIYPISKPYINTDQILLLLMKNNALSEQISWEALSRQRFFFEQLVYSKDEEDFPLHTMWGPIFPEKSFWAELSDKKMDLYKRWTKRRLKKTTNSIVFRNYVSGVKKASSDMISKIHFTSGYSKKTIEGFTKSLYYKSRDDKYHHSRKVWIPIDPRFFNLDTVELVFDRKYNGYYINVPSRSLDDYLGLTLAIELELEVTKVENFTGKKSGVLIHVNIRNCRLSRDGKTLWMGNVIHDNEQ